MCPLHATARLQTSIWALEHVGIGDYFSLGRGDCEDCGITLPPHFLAPILWETLRVSWHGLKGHVS